MLIRSSDNFNHFLEEVRGRAHVPHLPTLCLHSQGSLPDPKTVIPFALSEALSALPCRTRQQELTLIKHLLCAKPGSKHFTRT